MIRVTKSKNVPAVLIDKGIPEKMKNCQLYDTNPVDYDTGVSKFAILSSIYKDKSVKKQLIDEQHGKCCFCEADFTANSYGDVEHFRPKAGFRKTLVGKLICPGYYWLAYDWDNLFFSCPICNQHFKKNYFPLEDEANRAKNHTFDYQNESPSLLHPSLDNPEDHITFNRHVPVSQTNRGKLSIAGFGIDSDKLNKVREAYLQSVRNYHVLAGVDLNAITDMQRQQLSHTFKLTWDVLENLIVEAKGFMAVAAKDTQPFSAMIRANFPDLI